MRLLWLLSNNTPSRVLKYPLVGSTFIAVILEQPENTPYPILVTLLGIRMLVRPEHELKALSPILVTLLGITTLVRP